MRTLTHGEISAALRRRLRELERLLPEEMRRGAVLHALAVADRLRLAVPPAPRRFGRR